MVPVPDVLRQLQSFVNPKVPAHQRLIGLLGDFVQGRCRLYHPTTPLLASFASLPGVEAEGLFVADYNPTTERYGGSFHWLSKTSIDFRDCLAFQERLNQYFTLPSWSGQIDDLNNLPISRSATIGGLLVCRNGDGWITLAIMPVDLTPAVSLVHIVNALTVVLAQFSAQPEVFQMTVAHPMIDVARKSLAQVGDPRRVILLDTALDQIRKKAFTLAGAMPGEEDDFYRPDNELQVVFLLATRAYREYPDNPIRYWTEWEELAEVPNTLAHRLEERLLRYLKRRRSVMPDSSLVQLDEGHTIPRASVHAVWVVTRHPVDGLVTRLLVHRTVDPKIGLTYLEHAVDRNFPG